MNIGILTHAYPRYDGDIAGAFLERLVLALVARGHGVQVIAPADSGRGGRELRHHVAITRVRYAPARFETIAYRGTAAAATRSPAGVLWGTSLVLAQAAAVRRLHRGSRLDLIHAHWWVPGGLSAWLARRPYVLTLHGMDVVLLERSAMAAAMARRVIRGAAAVTAVSSDLAERAARAVRLDPRSIIIQPMPVELLRFVRASRGGGGIVTVGRLTPRKRIELLLEAVRHLNAGGRQLPLTIVGDGADRGRLEQLAADIGVSGQVRFIGEVAPDRVPEAIGDADVFAFPALGEGFGLVAAEALLCGVPVVAVQDGGGVRDIVPRSGGGRIVAPEPRAIARAIAELVDDPDARRLAAAAGDSLRRRLEPESAAERFEALYHQVLSRHLSGAHA